MSKKDNDQKGRIDRLRDGGGSLEVKTPDDDSAITGMISHGDSLLVVKEKGVYAIKLADQIDPERKNINVPNTIQRILPYGSSEPWVGATLLTGSELLKKEILHEHVDTERAMSLVVEIAQNIAGAFDILNAINSSQTNELEKYDLRIKKDRSVILPSMTGLTNKCKEFLQKTDHALDNLFKMVKVFYPNVGKGGWKSLKKVVEKENPPIDNFCEFLNQILPFLLFVRNARNCVEHPRNEQRIIVTDFSIDANNKLLPPLIEVVHPKTTQPAAPVVNLMRYVLDNIINTIELTLAFLCNRHIRPIDGFPVQVYEFPADQRRTENVKYGYGVAMENRIIRFG